MSGYTLPITSLMGSPVAVEAFVRHAHSGMPFAYPTATVYGLGTIVTDEGVHALTALKGRSDGKRFLVVSARPESFAELDWTPTARRLAKQFWPGRLTLILKDPNGSFPSGLRGVGGGVAVRHSAHPAVHAIEVAVGSPFTSTSANSLGQVPALDATVARETLLALGAEHPWVVDGGRLQPSPSSTIVDCTRDSPRVLREGTFSLQAIERALAEESADQAIEVPEPFRILFVCTGNTCRSPLAEVIARQRLDELGWAATAASAGALASRGAPASSDSAAVAAARGLNLASHTAQQLDATLIEDVDLILTMAPHHVEAAQELGGGGKVALLSAFAAGSADPYNGDAIVDPIGMGRDVYEATYEELARLIDRSLERLRPLLARP